MNTRIITVGQVDGEGDWQPDTTVGTPRIKGIIDTAHIVNGTHIGSGQYKFTDIPNDFYCFYDADAIIEEVLGSLADGGTPIVNPFTLDYLKKVAGSPNYFSAETLELRNVGATTDGASAINRDEADDRYVKEDGSNDPLIWVKVDGSNDPLIWLKVDGSNSMAGNLDMDGYRILNLPAPVSSGDPMRQSDTDVRYPRKDDIATGQNIFAPYIFRKEIYITKQPTNLLEGANRKFVIDYCTQILQGYNPTAYQQSLNILRVNYSGTSEVNKVFQTLTSAIAYADTIASSSRHILIVIEGNGAGGELTNYNLYSPSTMNPYIHIVGAGAGIKIRVAEDTYTGTYDQNIISNLFIDNENEDATTQFENKRFLNVDFINSFGGGSPVYEFQDCIFAGGCNISTGFVFTGTNRGQIFDLLNKMPISFAEDSIMNFQDDSVRVGNTTSGSGWTPSSEQYFGTNDALLGRPTDWIKITIAGIEYKIPIY